MLEACFALAAVAALAFAYERQLGFVDGFRYDDAFITLRYAHQLVTNGLLSYNPNEHIDGYTSTGWTLLLAAAERLGANPEAAMLKLSRAAGFASVLATAGLARALGARWLFAVAVAGVGVVFTPGFVVWCAPGMETPFASLSYVLLFTAFCVPTNALGERRSRRLVEARLVAIAVATLARPEGALLAALVWIAEATALRSEVRGDPARRRHALLAHVLVISTLVALFVWRWHYYGYPLPNTFYAKSPTPGLLARGFRDAIDFLGQRAIWVAPVAALMIAASAVSARVRAATFVFAAWFVCVIVVYARSGGDEPGFHRFYQPLVPISFAVFAALLSRAFGYDPSARAVLVRWVAVLSTSAMLYDGQTLPTAFERNVGGIRMQTDYVSQWRRAAGALARYLPKPVRLAVRPAGIIPYLTQAEFVYDTLALNNPTVAHHNPAIRDVPGHQKEATSEQVVAWRPDVIIAHPVIERTDHAGRPPDWWNAPEFRRAGYQYSCISITAEEYLCFWHLPNP